MYFNVLSVKKQMRKIVFQLFLIFCALFSLESCRENKNNKAISDSDVEELAEVYSKDSEQLPLRDTVFYYYQHYSQPSIDDAVIVFYYSVPANGIYNQIDLSYYGNTDEFCTLVRDNFLPGFFGIMIDDCTLQYSGKRCTNVNFTINLDERLTFSTPVEFPISNGEAAMRKGYKLWSMLDCEDMIKRHYGKMFRVTSFRGDMKKDELIVRRDNGNKEHGKERVFKKVTKDFVVKNYTKELVTNEMVKMYEEYYQEEDLYE